MGYRINCEDGVVINGSTLDEVLDNAERHLREAHPDLVATVGREQLAGWVEVI